MRIPITSPVGKWWVVAVPEGDLYVTDDDVFRDCFIPTTTPDKEPEDYEWIPETEIEDVYGIDFMESLPNIDDGEMVEIRIKCTAEKCE